MRRAALGAVVLLLSGPAIAQAEVATRTYEGREASALRCANMMAFTGITLNRAGLMADAEKDVLLGISVLILERHVSGPWVSKKRAMEVMRDRRSVDDTLSDYQRNAPGCLKRFPIN
ncbi:hypothetical protein KDD17_08850 [Sulfitobacter albidus]|uniref:Rap1a immunity protein domain-containing protein n=1 Tax=Sulfitobacter albidus TaxID=2829501 RepID=A0A975PKY0_9RHOB|nr:hypothetical protein [Sulfitobacter albidus]QUJ75138.1 hypothetical protein KDD17_08850 [Sulfitobacter albidus]